MTDTRWRVFQTRRGLPRPQSGDPLLDTLWDLDEWLDDHDILDRQPYLISPEGRYDVQLNHIFDSMLKAAPVNTSQAMAYDLVLWLTFLWVSRGRRDWREATARDRAAYKQWRTTDPRGPHVALTTWDREVADVNTFYNWAVYHGYTRVNPIVQRESRIRDPHRRGAGTTTPAEASQQGPLNDVEWMTAAMYRLWRDVGLRGLTASGLPNPSFRGRFASRNATYSDLLIRTGLRLCEQTALSLFDIPTLVPGVDNARAWLPEAIAKGGSARWVYYPASVLQALWDYAEMERLDAIEYARDKGLYEQVRDPLIVVDRRDPVVFVGGNRITVDKLDSHERQRLFIVTPDGLEPAALWLNESGLPSGTSCWQEVFRAGNRRCRRTGVDLSSHPHKLRHSFAVITLEQLWRGHLHDLAESNPGHRQTYQMVFGDPLNWVRIRLGHRSITTTLKYLHTLQELEMQTRMALIPDSWEPVAAAAAQPASAITADSEGTA